MTDPAEQFSVIPVQGSLSLDRHTLTIPLSAVYGSLTLQGNLGDDSVVIDLSLGNPIPAGGISYLGGENSGDNDSLEVTGYALNSADGVADVSVVHTGAESGSITLLGLGRFSLARSSR